MFVCGKGKVRATLSFVDGNINAKKYLDTLKENLWSVIARHFPTDGEIFQDGDTGAYG